MNLGTSTVALFTSQPTSVLPIPSRTFRVEQEPQTFPSHNEDNLPIMASADFAAAQARLLERRRARDAAEQARQSELQAARAAATTRLPYPFRNVGEASLSLWDAIKGREGTRPAFRVGQVDAELLDEELLELMKGQVGEALKYYGVWF
jgi:hypothetical protein